MAFRHRAGNARIRTRSLLASAQVMTGPVPTTAATGSGRDARSQELWDLYHNVGELHYAGWFIGACFSRVVLRPGIVGDDGKVGPLYDDEGNPVDGVNPATAKLAEALVRALKAPQGGQARLLSAIGTNLAIAADLWVVGTDTTGPDGKVLDRSWEALSTDEVRPRAGATTTDPETGEKRQVWERRRAPGSQPEEIAGSPYVLRIWLGDPQYSAMADSSVRAVTDVLEELILLTRGVRATALSRLAGPGLYWIPEEAKFTDDEGQPEDADQALERRLTEVMSIAVQNKGSASAFTPIVASMPGDMIQKIRHDTFQAPDDSLSILKRQEAVTRLGQGLPLPVEILTGMSAMNHWSAWQTDEATYKAHMEPLLEIVTDAFTAGYLHPALLTAAGLERGTPLPPEMARLAIWPDPTELVVHPNREAAAAEAYGSVRTPNFAISGSAYRRAKGFTEADRPDDEEVETRLRWAQLVNVRETVQGVVPEGADAQAPDAGAPAVTKGPPAGNGNGNGSAPNGNGLPASGQARLGMQVTIAAEHAVERAVERAGGRLRNRLRQPPELADVPNAELAARVGRQRVEALGPVTDLFTGEFAVFERLVTNWALAAGRDAPGAAAFARVATDAVTDLATRRLFDRDAAVSLGAFELADAAHT